MSMSADNSEYQFAMATRELGAFLHVVAGLYGPEEAERSAEDWINEFELMENTSELTPSDWRSITVAAAVRLAERAKRPIHQHSPPLTGM
jgi:hypothetical protein